MGARAAVLGSRAGAGSGAGRCPRPGALDPAAWGCLGLGSSEGQELSRGQGSQGPLAALQSAGRGRPGPSERRPGRQGRCSGCTRTRVARARNASGGFRRGTWAPPAGPRRAPSGPRRRHAPHPAHLGCAAQGEGILGQGVVQVVLAAAGDVQRRALGPGGLPNWCLRVERAHACGCRCLSKRSKAGKAARGTNRPAKASSRHEGPSIQAVC